MYFLELTYLISIKMSLKSVPKGVIDNIPALIQIMAWRQWGDRPLCINQQLNDGIFCSFEINFLYWFVLRNHKQLFLMKLLCHFICTFFSKNYCILIKISPRIVPRGLINNKLALVQVMWNHTIQQAITWTNVDPDLLCNMTSLSQNGLKPILVHAKTCWKY